jgi:xanthine dehydrogenase accessory factor
MIGRRAVLRDGAPEGSLGDAALDAAVRDQSPKYLRQGQSKAISVKSSAGDEVELFLDVYPVPPTLFVFGGVHVGIPLTKYAKILGFRVKVVDPRGIFATKERFAEADELVIEHPEDYRKGARFNEDSYVVVLTHDPKLDEPVLKSVLHTPATYVGAIGSRKTNQERNARLKGAGLTDEQLARIHAPIGLDIGSQTPEEIALAIIAEIVAARYGKDAKPLRETAGAAKAS